MPTPKPTLPLLRRRLLRVARESHPDADAAQVAAAVDKVIAERVTAGPCRPILDFLRGAGFAELLRLIAAILTLFALAKADAAK